MRIPPSNIGEVKYENAWCRPVLELHPSVTRRMPWIFFTLGIAANNNRSFPVIICTFDASFASKSVVFKVWPDCNTWELVRKANSSAPPKT